MKVIIQTIILVIAVTAALTMLIDHSLVTPAKSGVDHSSEYKSVPPKRVSRFLQQKVRNPNAADHCHKDAEVCNYILQGRNTTCCNNKCIDLAYDNKNCGACKTKCDATETCCDGECVNLAYDKRHCSECNNKCRGNGYCIYGVCDYA